MRNLFFMFGRLALDLISYKKLKMIIFLKLVLKSYPLSNDKHIKGT